jgi:hypothetical protein
LNPAQHCAIFRPPGLLSSVILHAGNNRHGTVPPGRGDRQIKGIGANLSLGYVWNAPQVFAVALRAGPGSMCELRVLERDTLLVQDSVDRGAGNAITDGERSGAGSWLVYASTIAARS